MRKSKLKHTLLKESFENISSELFSGYSDVITELIGRSAGIYALFDKNKLYYVGRATNLKSRVKQHLRDKHQKKWTHFSLYLIGFHEHIGDIESLLVRIALPKGNSVRPRGTDAKGERRLKQIIRLKHREELEKLLPGKRKLKTNSTKLKNKRNRENNRTKSLKGLVKNRVTLSKTYLGKFNKATLLPSGFILYKNKKYDTPTAAAKAIAGNKPINGWYFWRIKNRKGQLVKLKELKS